MQSNPGKSVSIRVGEEQWQRWPIRTHVIGPGDNIGDIAKRYARDLQSGNILFVSERAVAITQGRAFPIKDIHPSRLAKFLVKFVHKSPYGIGLGSPWTMELAIREAGISRILFAAAVSVLTKPFGLRGIFYKVVGKNLNAIDGPCDYTLPPYNEYAKLGPKNPDKVAKILKELLGAEVVIIDANDLGVAVLGKSNENISDEFCRAVFKDNPLGQGSEQTPMAIVRKSLDG